MVHGKGPELGPWALGRLLFKSALASEVGSHDSVPTRTECNPGGLISPVAWHRPVRVTLPCCQELFSLPWFRDRLVIIGWCGPRPAIKRSAWSARPLIGQRRSAPKHYCGWVLTKVSKLTGLPACFVLSGFRAEWVVHPRISESGSARCHPMPRPCVVCLPVFSDQSNCESASWKCEVGSCPEPADPESRDPLRDDP